MTYVAVVAHLIILNMAAYIMQQHAFPADELRPIACSGRFRGIGYGPNVAWLVLREPYCRLTRRFLTGMIEATRTTPWAGMSELVI
jgi:hypothetical protein